MFASKIAHWHPKLPACYIVGRRQVDRVWSLGLGVWTLDSRLQTADSRLPTRDGDPLTHPSSTSSL
ncbi:MAG: hypothetical protein LR006_01980, partial [Dehalococcoidia bacterium]|nr:hypothetical protein [Dehalococcoidia bacterium]